MVYCLFTTHGGSNVLSCLPTVTISINTVLKCFGTFLLSQPDMIKINFIYFSGFVPVKASFQFHGESRWETAYYEYL